MNVKAYSRGKYSPMEENLNLPIKSLLDIIQNRIGTKSKWCGIPIIKNPIDVWVYQEIIWEVRPNTIIEIGSRFGGSAAMLYDLQGVCGIEDRHVISVDIAEVPDKESVRRFRIPITFITGDACDPEIIEAVKWRIEDNWYIKDDHKVLVIEDSDHGFNHTLNVLECYSPFVTVGSYMIVEDGICHHGLHVGPNPGPYEAIGAFLKDHNEFVADRGREDFMITWNPKGYLKRVK